MPNITLPDGLVRSYDGPVTAATIASDIGSGLAKIMVYLGPLILKDMPQSKFHSQTNIMQKGYSHLV